jgi:hypothetical protein
MGWLWVLFLIIVNQTVVGFFCRFLANEKNRDGETWFWLGFFFGPIPIALFTLIGLPALSHEQRDELQRRRRLSRYAHELTALSLEDAKVLAAQNGDLSLVGLVEISDEAAAVLATHKGHLSLDGLATLSNEAAKALAQHEGDLFLNGLTAISDEAASVLAKHRGLLRLTGLNMLSDAAIQALRANPRVALPYKSRIEAAILEKGGQGKNDADALESDTAAGKTTRKKWEKILIPILLAMLGLCVISICRTLFG